MPTIPFFFQSGLYQKIIPKWYKKIKIFGIRKLKIWSKKIKFLNTVKSLYWPRRDRKWIMVGHETQFGTDVA